METFNKQDLEWIEKCKDNPAKYHITVDNDCISVNEYESGEYKEDGEYYTFNEFGYTFALQLLNYLGCNAEMC